MSQALKGACGAMHHLNQMTKLPELQKIVYDFMRENEMQDMKSEMMDDTMNDVWDTEGTMEEDTAQQYAQIFQEMRIPMPAEIAAQVSSGQMMAV
jgi:charged multivesicular body protein 2A